MTRTRPATSTDRIHAVVRMVPRGRVVNYGQVARLAGLPGAARQVGYAMAALGPDSGVPWHRVVRADGSIAPRSGRRGCGEQRQVDMLAAEGVVFGEDGRVDLATYRWRGPGDGPER